MDKRGQGLSTNAIILIILGVVVLVVLILGFMLGWDTLAPWLSSENVDTIVRQCSAACSTAKTYDFCTKTRTLKSQTEELKDVTCYYLSKKKTTYGIEECSAVDCDIEDDLIAAKEKCTAEKTTAEAKESEEEKEAWKDVEVTYLTDAGQKTEKCSIIDVAEES